MYMYRCGRLYKIDDMIYAWLLSLLGSDESSEARLNTT